MIEWRDEALVLTVRPHGETAAIAELFTAAHGRHLGVVRGGAGRRMRPVLQPGARVEAAWRARLDEHIGAFVVEPVRSSAALMADPAALAALNAVAALLSFTLAEREPQPDLYRATSSLLAALEGADWPADYLRWELHLLETAGFGLDLARCAVTGSVDDLAYVSPRSGRAVSRAGAGDWASRLLPLPACLRGTGPASRDEVASGLRMTGHFLAAHLAAGLGDRPLPAARARLVTLLSR